MPKRIIQKTSILNEEKLNDLLNYTTNKDDCKIWKGAVNTDGYAAMAGNVKVHRLVYELSNPNEEIKGLVIRHTCDTPLCINPNHLLKGTFGDNGHDKFIRNRQPRVITKEIVFKVRELLNSKVLNMRQIAKALNIDERRVSDINRNLYNDEGKFKRR